MKLFLIAMCSIFFVSCSVGKSKKTAQGPENNPPSSERKGEISTNDSSAVTVSKDVVPVDSPLKVFEGDYSWNEKSYQARSFEVRFDLPQGEFSQLKILDQFGLFDCKENRPVDAALVDTNTGEILFEGVDVHQSLEISGGRPLTLVYKTDQIECKSYYIKLVVWLGGPSVNANYVRQCNENELKWTHIMSQPPVILKSDGVYLDSRTLCGEAVEEVIEANCDVPSKNTSDCRFLSQSGNSYSITIDYSDATTGQVKCFKNDELMSSNYLTSCKTSIEDTAEIRRKTP